ncbi:FkbM family methyltransferase [Thiorhodococcus minor]|uniref:FkbM family methyltransferase n=1 Tax=Thiorhodococcus minor TaxID=57489 RepID=A0A6M0JZS6_9GAMM|nr:FkbM family methyltransferase [Thiorhodococcus minor]
MRAVLVSSLRKLAPVVLLHLIRRILCFFDWDPWQATSWAQEGEDRILQRIFERQSSGFYVDVGAHHPKRFSNTYLFYRRGWSGINVDAAPGSMDAFRKLRPRDTNLELGVALDSRWLDFFVFTEPALNGFSYELSQHRVRCNNKCKILDVKRVKTEPLSSILERCLPENRVIDFLTIDVEGFDLEVLKSNDWQRFRPKYVLVESLESSLHTLFESDLAEFMRECGYSIYAKCVNTIFFKKHDVPHK